MRTSRAGTSIRSGFTLIELVVVLFIVALLASLVMPRLGAFLSHGDTNKAIRQLRGVVRYLTGLAATSKGTYRIYYDIAAGSCWVGKVTEGEQVERDNGFLTRQFRLPPGVRFAEVITPRGVYKEGVAYTEFSPTGWVEETLIQLEGDARVTLRLLPLSGEVRVYEGFVEVVQR